VKQADLIVHDVRQLVTCSSRHGSKHGEEMLDPVLIRGGAVAITGGRITGVGETQQIFREFTGETTIDASGRVVTPGFVDAHTHAVFAGNRLDEFEQKIEGANYLEILAKGGGIHSTTRATRSAKLDHLVELSAARLNTMLTLGTTTLEIKTGYGLERDAEMKMLKAIERLDKVLIADLVPTFMAAHAVPPEFTNRPDAYVYLIVEELLPAAVRWYREAQFRKSGVPFFVDVFCETGAFNVAQSRRVLQAGRSHGLAVKAHVDQFTNLGGVAMALELDAVSLDHLDTMRPRDVRLIAQSKTIAVITPAANLSSGSTSFADARALIDDGAAVAFSTDFNPGSSPCLSIPLVMGIACRYCRVTPAEALNGVTINAAYALGLGGRVGSIEVGKQADLLILDVDDYREIAYVLGGNPVAAVIKNGNVVPPTVGIVGMPGSASL
jgi:imidazolonepropionase